MQNQSKLVITSFENKLRFSIYLVILVKQKYC